MKTNQSKIAVVLSASSILMSSFAFAQGSSSGGNGGGGEGLFHNHSSAILEWLEKYLADGTLTKKLHLDESKTDAEFLVKSYREAVSKVHVKFIPNDKLDEECVKNGDVIACRLRDTSRTCINVTKPIPVIECNEDLFTKRPGDEQFVITFHEHLGIKKIEVNDSKDFSSYPISRYLMNFANPKTTVRWELSEKSTNKFTVLSPEVRQWNLIDQYYEKADEEISLGDISKYQQCFMKDDFNGRKVFMPLPVVKISQNGQEVVVSGEWFGSEEQIEAALNVRCTENGKVDEKCLDKTRSLFKKWKDHDLGRTVTKIQKNRIISKGASYRHETVTTEFRKNKSIVNMIFFNRTSTKNPGFSQYGFCL